MLGDHLQPWRCSDQRRIQRKISYDDGVGRAESVAALRIPSLSDIDDEVLAEQGNSIAVNRIGYQDA
jgi:hypothetical protein